MTNRKLLIGVLIILLAVVLFFSLKLKQQVPISPTSIESTKAETVLTLSPNPLLLSSENGSVDVVMDTGANSVNFVQIKLLYDPKFLSDITITQGAFMKHADVLNTFTNQDTGTLTYILVLSRNTKPIQGKGVIATITFQSTLESGQSTSLTFMKETLITNDAFVGTLLKKTEGTKIVREK